MPEDEVDREFARIVAGWHTSTAGGPEEDDASETPGEVPPLGAAPREVVPGARPDVPVLPDVPTVPVLPLPPMRPIDRPSGLPSGRPPADGRTGSDEPEPGSVESWLDEGFTPPPVRLPGEEDPQFWGIVVGLTVGPLALILLMLFGDGWSPWWSRAAWAMTLGGFVLLVLRQPTHRDHDDPDDGARV